MENKLKMEQDLKEQANKTPAKPTTENTGSFWSGFTTYSPLNYFYGTKSSESPKLSTQSSEEERLRQIQERQSIELAIRNAQEREKLKNLHIVIRLRTNQSSTEDLNNQQDLTPTPDKEALETPQVPPNLTTTPIIDNNSQTLVQTQEELELQRQQEEQQRQQQQQLELQRQREEEQRRQAAILLQQQQAALLLQQQAALLLQQKQHQQREAEERKRHNGFTRQEVLTAKALYAV